MKYDAGIIAERPQIGTITHSDAQAAYFKKQLHVLSNAIR